MSNSGFELVARFRGLPFERYLALVVDADGTRRMAVSVGFDPIFGWQWVPQVPTPSGPFPWGFDVEPD